MRPNDPAFASLPAPLVERQADFLRFLRARLPSDEAAREALQAAWVRALEHAPSLRDRERAVAWFYRLLRNGLADRRRRELADERLRAAALGEPPAPPALVGAAPCRCVAGAIEGLKPAHAALLRRVDLEGASVPDAAREAGVSANAAAVRLHRGRAALRDALLRRCGACARHGCLECDCGGSR